MSKVFSLYVDRESPVHRLHPLTKVAAMGFLLVGGFILPGILGGYLLFLLILIPLAKIAGVSRALLSRTWRVVLPFAVSVFLIQGFLWPGGTPVFVVGLASLKQEGLIFAIASTGRIIIVVRSFLWFAVTTRPDMLMNSLAQRGLPTSLTYLIVTTIQIVPRFQARAITILDAQRARGLETEGNMLQRTRGIFPLVVPLILSSLVDVEERAMAMEARAFNRKGRKTTLIEIQEAAWEPFARWGLVIGLLWLFLLRFWIR